MLVSTIRKKERKKRKTERKKERKKKNCEIIFSKTI